MKILKGMRKLDEQQRDQIIESLRRLSAMVDVQELDMESEGEFF